MFERRKRKKKKEGDPNNLQKKEYDFFRGILITLFEIIKG